MSDLMDPVEMALARRAKSDAKINAVLQADLHAALSRIDQRHYQARDVLTVNQPAHTPAPRVYVPSRSRIAT